MGMAWRWMGEGSLYPTFSMISRISAGMSLSFQLLIGSAMFPPCQETKKSEGRKAGNQSRKQELQDKKKLHSTINQTTLVYKENETGHKVDKKYNCIVT
jgi:hypothetical protein